MWCKSYAKQENKSTVTLCESVTVCALLPRLCLCCSCICWMIRWLFGITWKSYCHVVIITAVLFFPAASVRLCAVPHYLVIEIKHWFIIKAFICHFVCCYFIGPECFWGQSLLPSAGQELTMPLSEQVLSAFNVVCQTCLFREGGERKADILVQLQKVYSVRAHQQTHSAHTLEARCLPNHSSSASRLFLPDPSSSSSPVQWGMCDRSRHRFPFTQLSIPTSHLFSHTCTDAHRYTHREQPPFWRSCDGSLSKPCV